MTPDAKRRFAVLTTALAAYAAGACATPPAEPQPMAWHDEPVHNTQPTRDKPADWDIHPPRARAGRGTRRPARGPEGPQAGGDVRVVTSTAYCLTGTMANGQRAHAGAVAMNGVPLGSVWAVDGAGTYTVADRIGHGSQFDIAMPGDCGAAIAYGRRTITVRRVS